MFNSFRTASTKLQKLFSRGPRSERLGSSALTGINIFKPLWMQQICSSAGITIGSPSMCITPGFGRRIVNFDVRNEWMLVSWSICPVKSRKLSIAVSSGVKGCITVTSIKPSCILA